MTRKRISLKNSSSHSPPKRKGGIECKRNTYSRKKKQVYPVLLLPRIFLYITCTALNKISRKRGSTPTSLASRKRGNMLRSAEGGSKLTYKGVNGSSEPLHQRSWGELTTPAPSSSRKCLLKTPRLNHLFSSQSNKKGGFLNPLNTRTDQ